MNTPLRDRVRELLFYRDGNLYWREKRTRNVDISKPAGCIDDQGYRRIKIDYTQYKAHRLIFLLEHGRMPDFVDHIDGNKDNNAIHNLRECTKAQNSWNRKTAPTNTSGFKGVKRVGNKWKATLTLDGRVIHLGYFDTVSDAAEAYACGARLHFGEFARVA